MRIKFCTTIVPSKPIFFILYGKLVRCRIYGNSHDAYQRSILCFWAWHPEVTLGLAREERLCKKHKTID